MKTSVVLAFFGAVALSAGGSQVTTISRASSVDVCQAGYPTAGCSQLQSSTRTASSLQLGLSRARRAPTVSVSEHAQHAERREASLLELDQSRVKVTRLFHGYARFERASASMDKRAPQGFQELGNSISKLLQDQGAAPAGCASRLKDLEKNLKNFHSHLKAAASDLRESKQETQAADADLKDSLAGIKALTDKRSEKLATCDEKVSADRSMLERLEIDLREMRGLRKGLATANATNSMAMVQLSSFLRASSPEISSAAGQLPPRPAQAQQLVTNTKAASLEMHACFRGRGRRPQTEVGTLLQFGRDIPTVASIPTVSPPVQPLVAEPLHCAAERQRLQESYEQAYHEITLEVASYQALVVDKSCADAEEGVYKAELNPMLQQEGELSGRLAVAVGKVESLRPQLDNLRHAHLELHARIDHLHSECDALVKTKKSLQDTKDVIKTMGDCAGTEPVDFYLPCWVGKWITADLDEHCSIEEADAAMNTLCANTFGAQARSAETAEVDTGSIVHMPTHNDAQVPLLPTCPLCGTKDARVCWDAGELLEHRRRRKDCDAEGQRAVLCVADNKAARTASMNMAAMATTAMPTESRGL